MRHAKAEGTHKDASVLPQDLQRIQNGELDEILLRIRPDVVLYSPWLRTTQTAEYIRQRLEQIGVSLKEFKSLEELALEVPQDRVLK